MKNQLKHQSVLLVFFTMVPTIAPAAFDSSANQMSIPPIFSINRSEVNEVTAETNMKIDRMILSQEDRILTTEFSKSKNQNSHDKQMIMRAKKDLAHRLSVEIDQIKLLEVRQVTWPDSSLGCPQPGKVYNQVPQDGILIRLRVEGHMYFYHSGKTMNPFLCEQTSQVVPHPTGGDEFVPPPGSEID